MSKNWQPDDLRDTKHLLAEHRAEKLQKSWYSTAIMPDWPIPECGWKYIGLKKKNRTVLLPFRLGLTEFRYFGPRTNNVGSPQAKDYSDASEGNGLVSVRGSNYDVEEPEVHSPYDAIRRVGDTRRRTRADESNTLGFFAETTLVEGMTDAVRAWAGLTTPAPKAADVTVEKLVADYLANGGQVHSAEPYWTTPRSRIRFRTKNPSCWAAGCGIPPELRKLNKRFRVIPKTGSKYWRDGYEHYQHPSSQ